MVMSAALIVVGVLDVLERGRPKPDNVFPSTTMDVEPTETILPLTIITPATFPLVPLAVLPDGALPTGALAPAPLGGPPPAPPLKPPPRPPVMAHDPEVGWPIVTERAVMVPADEVPVTVTHSPAFAAARVSLAVWVNLVEPVHVTVVCPL